MSKIEKLTEIRDKIIDEFVTKENVKKIKSKYSFKDGFLKSIFKFLFLKPFKLKEIKTTEDLYFTDNNRNIVKQFGCIIVFLILALFIISSLSAHEDATLMYFVIALVFIPTISVAKIEWNIERNKINKRFDPQNINTIKKDLFNSYDEEEINLLFGESLNKKALIDILAKINEVVNEEELLEKFEKLETKNYNDITLPYNLISTINKVIEDLKKKEKEIEESGVRETNRKNLRSLTNEYKKQKQISIV